MAHTNSTSNYSLSQFVGTDKPTFLGDYNGDMLKIDAAIKSAADAADGAVTTANAASALATDAASTASGAASDASTASATATTALNTANNATTTANSASATATSAASDAATAVSTANSAMSAATVAATASGTSYDHTTSGLVANTVQSAIDEIVAGGGSQHGIFELWKNPTPAQEFAGNSSEPIVISSELDFDSIWFEIGISRNEVIAPVVRSLDLDENYTGTMFRDVAIGRLDSAAVAMLYSFERSVSVTHDAVNNTYTVVFTDATTYNKEATATTAASGVVNNGNLVPYRILGLVHNS